MKDAASILEELLLHCNDSLQQGNEVGFDSMGEALQVMLETNPEILKDIAALPQLKDAPPLLAMAIFAGAMFANNVDDISHTDMNQLLVKVIELKTNS